MLSVVTRTCCRLGGVVVIHSLSGRGSRAISHPDASCLITKLRIGTASARDIHPLARWAKHLQLV